MFPIQRGELVQPRENMSNMIFALRTHDFFALPSLQLDLCSQCKNIRARVKGAVVTKSVGLPP